MTDACRPLLRVYGHAYCSLCKEMLAALRQWPEPLQVEWVDIEGHNDLESRFGELVPVLCGEDGVTICHYHLDSLALDAYLADFR
ncbi:glutaredoxin family protein [Chitinilyticum aquatile]|uniref:glutaredoxin family protein n=1 Tax=Chitinilyticum aquatile TaxID=362520 RepID=UPI0003FF2AB9|nr:glutaredoxin family protein [Chitinilyticum aquatile]